MCLGRRRAVHVVLVETCVRGVDGVELSLHLVRVTAPVGMVGASHGAAILLPPRAERGAVGSPVGTPTARRVAGLAAHGQPRAGSVAGSIVASVVESVAGTPVPGVTSSTTTSTGPPTRPATASRT